MADDTGTTPDAGSAPDAQSAVPTPYLVTLPDGSTSTYTLHTSRPPTIGEVADYAAAHGQQFSGFPEGPSAPSPPPAEAPSPVLTNAPPEPAPTLAGRAYNALVPRRTLMSQVVPMSTAAVGGMYGAEAGAPFFPPFGSIVGGLVGAGLGGAGGEALQYGGEQAIGLPPAEPGTFGQRVVGAGLRGAAGELVPSAIRGVAQRAETGVLTPLRAAAELRPILTGTAPEAPAGIGAAEALSPQYALPRWWQSVSQGKPEEIVQAWNDLGKVQGAQEQLAGDHVGAMRVLMNTIAQGAKPWGAEIGPVGAGGIYGAAYSALFGHPQAVVPALAPAAYDIAGQMVPKAVSAAVRSPGVVPWVSRLPAVADVAGPMIMAPLRAGSQVYVAEQGPSSETLLP